MGDEFEEVLNALRHMYEQYCHDGHAFMSAGEQASAILEFYEVATFDETGKVVKWLK